MVIISNKIIDKFLSLIGAEAMSNLGFLIFIKTNLPEMERQIAINHESIHCYQARELLILPWYIFYGINYILNLLTYLNHNDAYMNIIFEREAYTNENDFTYLKIRHLFSFLRY